jgi:hypothetical protein
VQESKVQAWVNNDCDAAAAVAGAAAAAVTATGAVMMEEDGCNIDETKGPKEAAAGDYIKGVDDSQKLSKLVAASGSSRLVYALQLTPVETSSSLLVSKRQQKEQGQNKQKDSVAVTVDAAGDAKVVFAYRLPAGCYRNDVAYSWSEQYVYEGEVRMVFVAHLQQQQRGDPVLRVIGTCSTGGDSGTGPNSPAGKLRLHRGVHPSHQLVEPHEDARQKLSSSYTPAG